MLDFGMFTIQPKLSDIKFWRKNIKFGDFSYNRMKVFDNFEF